MSLRWQVIITPLARAHLLAIADQRVRQAISQVIDRLETDPERRGKPLTGDLAGFHSIRAAGQRYRIIYRIVERQVHVYVVTVGLRQEGSRRDVYAQATRLLADWQPPEAPPFEETSTHDPSS